MRILLIAPPIADFFFSPQRAYPLALLSLATVLEKRGFTVKILNCLERDYRKKINLPSCFSYLRRYYRPNLSPFCLFSHYYHFGLSQKQIKKKIKEFAPHLVGISANFWAYFNSSLKIAQLVKKIDSRIIVVLGGRVPTLEPELALINPNVDFVLRGEAEETFFNLCKDLKKGGVSSHCGLCYRRRNKKEYISSQIPLIPDLNTLPILNRRLIDIMRYRFRGEISTSLLASRGCNFGCSFCGIWEQFRYRKAENVLKEMEDCFSLGIRHFNFEDDIINFHPEFETMIEMIIERFKGKIKLSFMNGLSTYRMKKSLIQKLVKAGLTHLDFSLISSQGFLRKRMARKENAHRIFKLSNLLGKYKIPVTLHFIVGFPHQRFQDSVRDVRFLSQREVMLGASIFYPLKESKLFQKVEKELSPEKKNYIFFRSSTAVFEADITRDRIFLIFYLSRIINFIKRVIDKETIEGKDLKSFLEKRLDFLNLRENKFTSPLALDRYTLGLLLLYKLLTERRIYRIVRRKIGSIFLYHLFVEEFVSPDDVERVLKDLKVRSRGAKTVKL